MGTPSTSGVSGRSQERSARSYPVYYDTHESTRRALDKHKALSADHVWAVLRCGKQWVDRPMAPYTGNRDDTTGQVDEDELGTDIQGVEWPDNIEELKAYIVESDLP